MKKFFRQTLGRRGVASVELGLVAPTLITMCVAISDFSIVYHKQLQISSALTAAGEYAYTKGQSETGTALASDVASFLQAISAVNLSSASASFNGGLNAADYYCVSGSPATYSGPYNIGSTCTDGSTAGQFISISATYSYTPMFGANKAFLPGTYTQSVIVRLQ
jgi:Flp pilus assembly protein TadG